MRSLLVLSFLFVAARTVAGANIPSLPPGWSYIGCLYEGNGARIMTDEFLGTNDMTIQDCVTYCQGTKHTPYAALEVGTQCFCGSHLDFVRPVSETNCQYPCPGDSSQRCGGYGHMSFFSKTVQDPRISAGLIDRPSSSTSAIKSSATLGPSPSPAQSQVGTPSLSSSSISSVGTASPSVRVLEPAQDTQSQSPGFTLPSDITTPPPQNPSTSSFPPGFSAPVETGIGRSSSTRRMADIPTAAIAENAGQGGVPNFQDYSKMVVYGKYASASSRSTQTSFRFLLVSMVIWIPVL